MKIKTKRISYEKVVSMPAQKHKKPKKPNIFWRTVIRIASIPDLWGVSFKYEGKLPKETPFLVLMNHSCFLDMEISSRILYPIPYGIVTTYDGMVGKEWLMRQIGCIPTHKFINDITLIKDISYMIKKLKTSVLMYPEASYSFDSTATPLPEKFGRLIKMLEVPVVMIKTEGAFARDPLYNGLQKRKVKVSAKVNCLLSQQEVKEKTVEEIDEILKDAFTFDHFRWQKEKGVKVTEPFRADGLERILYKCPACKTEGKMCGKGETITCSACGKVYRMNEYGEMQATVGKTEFSHIPHWYAWQRQEVKNEIENKTYLLNTQVDIGMLVDGKAIYMVGDGRLVHSLDGFNLVGCDGKLNYTQKPLASYSLYADYYWYEIGDVISIGNKEAVYYCFPKDKSVPVAKARLAAEELYKYTKSKKRT